MINLFKQLNNWANQIQSTSPLEIEDSPIPNHKIENLR